MQSTAIGRRAPTPLPYLDEARDLYNLLRDGHDALRFHISRGHALRHADTGRIELASYVEPGRWLPARTVHPDGTQTDRALNPYVLAQHLAGKYDVAWESPSWSSLLVLDIDAHVPGGLEGAAHWQAAREAARRRDATLARVWRAFGFGADKQPIILKTPGGGYHLYLPLLRERDESGEALWPNAGARRWVEHYLARAGLELAPGHLELFPSGVRLRAPCGRGMLLMQAERPDDPDSLRLEPVAGTYRGRLGVRGIEADFEDIDPSEDSDAGMRIIPLRGYSARRDVGAMCRAFLAAIEAARRPLGQWLGAEEPLWHPVWGPFGATAPGTEPLKKNQGVERGDSVLAPHKEEVQRGCGPCPPSFADDDSHDGWLLHGRAYLRRVVDLTENGLTEPGERHDAALKLTFYWGAVMALPRDEVVARLGEWLRAFPHRSNLAATSEAKFIRETLREAVHYYDHRVQHCAAGGRRRFDIALQPLAPADLAAFQAAVAPDAWRAVKAVLGYLRGHAEPSGLVPQPVDLSQKALLLVCGDRRIQDEHGRRRRAYLVALEELERLGVLTLHQNYSKGRHGRRFSVWYRFGSGELPKPLETGELVLAERELTEGTLRILGRGDGHHQAHLEPHPDLQAAAPPSSAAELATSAEPAAVTGALAAAAADLDQRAGRAWWRRMFAARVFTVAELAHADERTVIPGPWTWRRVSPPPAHPIKPPCDAPPGPPPPANDQVPDASAALAAAPGAVACSRPAPSPWPSSPTPTSVPPSSPTCALPSPEEGQATRVPAPSLPAPPGQPEPEFDPDLKSAVERAWKAFADRNQSSDSS